MFSLILNRAYSVEGDEMELERRVFFGNFFHCLSFDVAESILDGFLAVESGKIVAVGRGSEFSSWDHPKKKSFKVVRLSDTQFLLPGFCDTHIHAPQVPNLGMGLDKPLMEWLDAYTFPMETEYKDDAFAAHVYEKVVRRTLDVGTTTASYFGTIHKTACQLLANQVHQQGQRAFVGKVSMNQNSPDTYIETFETSIRENEEFIQHVLALKSDLVTPVVTPRFAITCSMELLKELAELAKKYELPIQSHISENLDEINFTLELFPGHSSYAAIYDAAGLLTDKCIMAHGIHLSDEELKLFAQRGTSVSHCPSSNTNLKSGLCDVKRLMAKNVKVGLGTDCSGGCRISILDNIKNALDVSQHLNILKKQNVLGTGKMTDNTGGNANYVPLDYKQGIFLATLGGAQALSLDHKIGNFLVGKDFDALLVETYAGCVDKFTLPEALMTGKSPEDKLQQLLQKFIYSGDDRNIFNVYVKGRQVK